MKKKINWFKLSEVKCQQVGCKMVSYCKVMNQITYQDDKGANCIIAGRNFRECYYNLCEELSRNYWSN